MAKKLEFEKTELEWLRKLLEVTTEGQILYCNPTVHALVFEHKLAEYNSAMKDGEGCVATRITKKGQEYLLSLPPVEAEQAQTVENLPVPASMGAFELRADVPVPEAKRGGKGKPSIWPFEQMEVGHSFFISDGAGFEAAKKYASTVSSVTARYSEPVPGETRDKQILVKYSVNTPIFDPSGAQIGVHKAGDPVIGGDGKKVYRTEKVQAMRHTREFVIRAATGDSWGKAGVKGAGVWRTK
jgi:hypothetical protein